MIIVCTFLIATSFALIATLNGDSRCLWQEDVRTWSITAYTTDFLCSVSFDVLVKVEIQKLSIEPSPNCEADFLGYNSFKVCNSQPPPTTVFFLWPGDSILFESDSVDDSDSDEFRGVELLFLEVDTSEFIIFPTSMSGPCGWDPISHHWFYRNYYPNTQCSITFDETVKVLTRGFDVEGSDNCERDGVTLKDITFCNSIMPTDFNIVNPGGTIEFFSDENGEPGDFQGFAFAILPWDQASNLPTKHPSDVPSQTPSFSPSSIFPSLSPSKSPTLPIRFCDSSDCNGHGVGAGNTLSGCDCSCDDGWGGATCEERVCAVSDCNGNGVPDGSPYSDSDGCNCICDGNFQPPTCLIESCSRVDCNDHGTGSGNDRTQGCACSCDDGWSGTTCETMACLPSDCSNHGTTTDEVYLDGCECTCDEGWTGDICETPTCTRDNDCSGHGSTTDVNRLDGCDCVCDPGFNGESCQIEACTVADCGGAGTTMDTDRSDGCDCICAVGFDGQSCSATVITETVALYALFLHSDFFGMLSDPMVADLFTAMSENLGFAVVLQQISKPRNNVLQFSAEANVDNSVKFQLLSAQFEELITAQFLAANSRRYLQSNEDFSGLYIDIVETLPIPSASPSMAPSQVPSVAPTSAFTVYVEYLYIENSNYLTLTTINDLLSLLNTELNERDLASELELQENLGDNVVRISVTTVHASTIDVLLSRSFEAAIATRLRELDSSLEPIWVDIYLEPTTSSSQFSIIVNTNTTDSISTLRSGTANSSEEWYSTTWGLLVLIVAFLTLCICCCIWYRVANIIMVDDIELMDDVKDVRETSNQYAIESQYIIGEKKRGPTTAFEQFTGFLSHSGTVRDEKFTTHPMHNKRENFIVEVLPSPKDMQRNQVDFPQIRFNSRNTGGASMSGVFLEEGAVHRHNRL